MLVNTHYFTEVARNGYTKAPEGTYDYVEWWTEQHKRCLEGYRIGGLWIPGRYYFYLNFCPIYLKDKNKVDFPRFTDLDLEYFLAVEEAIEKRMNLCVIKARQKGFSFKNASLATYEFHLVRESICMMGAYRPEYADDVWKKFCDYSNFLKGTAFGKNCWPDNSEYKRAAYFDKDSQSYKGYMSEIHKISFNKKSDAGIGKAFKLGLWEEIGKFPTLLESLAYTIDTIKYGSTQSGSMILYGSAGDMEHGGSVAAQEIFYNPEKYNCLAFDNTYEEGSNKIGFFVPKSKFYPPFVDEHGNSDIAGAKEHILQQRLKLQTGNTVNFNLEVIQNPEVPSEAFILGNDNPFDGMLLNEQIRVINNNRDLKNSMQYGDLVWVDNLGNPTNGISNKVKWVPGNPKKNSDGILTQNVFQIWEHPDDKISNKMNTIYVGGCDSYDWNAGTSQGSMFIYKRFTDLEHTGQMFVAEVTTRPKLAEQFYELCAKLCVYYNCKVLIEHSTIAIINWFQKNGFTQYLKGVPLIAYKNMARPKLNYEYGLKMNDATKSVCEAFMKTYIVNNSNRIFFLDLLIDMLRYTRETNHDRTMAAMLCTIHEADLSNKTEVKDKRVNNGFPVFQYTNGRVQRVYKQV